MSDDDRIQAVCRAKAGLVDSNANLWTLVGEWTPANTDCAVWLNGESFDAYQSFTDADMLASIRRRCRIAL